MKLKYRIKSALFSFFKEEILNYVGYAVNGTTQVQFVSNEVKFTRITSEIFIGEDDSRTYGTPMEILYEKSLKKCKDQLFEDSMKFIQIDNSSVMDSHLYNGRRIKVSLFIGQPKN